MKNFEDDLNTGIRAQNFIIKQLEKEYGKMKSSEGNFKDYDLINDKNYTFEVKFDLLSRETGNVGIEYSCNNQKSGISATKANGWIHIYFLDNRWVYSKMDVTELKNFIKENWDYFKKVVGGDGNRAKIILIPIKEFANKFDFIEIPKPEKD
jgi:hypothetical protein